MPQKVDFENPDKKPLGELYIKQDGVQMEIPALSAHWVQKKDFIKYTSLIGAGGEVVSGAELDEWLTNAELFKKDMEYLLELNHFRFWSHLVFEATSIEAITSFLQEATPFYLDLPMLIHQPKVILLYSDILQYVLRVICRMITNKESEGEWIRKDHLRELLYSKFLISIPMIFDMITAYGRSNLNILSKIIHTIFKIEPKYNEDLRIGIQYLQKAFNVIQKKAENEGVENDNEPASSLEDLALYTMDCAYTLSILLEAYPEARSLCSENRLEQSITHFYDNTITLLYKNIFTINPSSPSLEHLNRARIELLKAFRSLINSILEEILHNPEQSLLPAENYIAILTECLADRTFVADYQKFFPVENDIDILRQACKDLDEFKADFILKAYTSEEGSYLVDLAEYNGLDDHEESDTPVANGLVDEMRNLTIDFPPRDIEKEVSKVQDILSHLGDGFIRKLLQRYNNTEEAISALLEGNLPPDLAEADQSEVYIPPDPKDALYNNIGISRNNVFDGDEYDIMTHDNPKCIIKAKKGFPGQPKNVEQLLDDKTYVKEMKDKYQEYSLVTEDNEYDDEYDDSYEALAESEAKTAKSKAVQNVLVDEVADEESEEEEEDDDEEDADELGKKYLENPADIRARYEAQRNARFNARGKSRDVVGKPKGHGQEKEVVTNRKFKEAHKSSRANHNRKSGAAWKRSRGMMPF